MRKIKGLKNILQKEIEIPTCVDEKIQDAYAFLEIDVQQVRDVKTGKIANKHWGRMLTVKIAVAVVLCLALPIGVLAVNGYFNVLFSIEEPEGEQLYNKGIYHFNEDMSLTTQAISFSFTQIPEGYDDVIGVIAKESGEEPPSMKIEKYRNENGNITYQGSISVSLYTAQTFEPAFAKKTYCVLDMDNHTILFPNIIDEEEMQVGEISVSILSTSSGEKHVIFFNQMEGYIGEIFVGGKVTSEEMIEVIKGIAVTTTEIKEVSNMSDAEIEKALAEGLEVDPDSFDRYLENEQVAEENLILKEDISSIGDTVEIDTWYALKKSEQGKLYKTVNQVQVFEQLDSVKYSQEHMIPWEENKPFINQNGTLNPAIKNILDQDGNVIGTEEVALSWIAVDVTVENKTDQTLEYYAAEPFASIEMTQDGNYVYKDSLDYGLLQHILQLKFTVYLSEIDLSDIEQKNPVDLEFIHIAPHTTVQYTAISIIEKEALQGELLLQGNIVVNAKELK